MHPDHKQTQDVQTGVEVGRISSELRLPGEEGSAPPRQQRVQGPLTTGLSRAPRARSTGWTPRLGGPLPSPPRSPECPT